MSHTPSSAPAPPQHGVVFIAADRHGLEWTASWQSAHLIDGYVSLDGVSREEAIRWGREKPALRYLIHEPGSDDYVDLDHGHAGE